MPVRLAFMVWADAIPGRTAAAHKVATMVRRFMRFMLPRGMRRRRVVVARRPTSLHLRKGRASRPRQRTTLYAALRRATCTTSAVETPRCFIHAMVSAYAAMNSPATLDTSHERSP